MSNKIADAFGVENPLIERPKRIVTPIADTYDDFTKQMIEHRKSDYGTVRDNIINLLNDMSLVVDSAVDTVRSEPTARNMESFATLVKTFADINKDLMTLTEKTESKSNPSNPTGPENAPINNVIFVGTSDSLIDQIRSQMK